jgi:ubiquinone/menaquinone biosynthesis C-methylase UbiE
MDYDKTDMARGYDSGRSYSPEQRDRWLDVISDSVGAISVRKVLDLGCGTGRFSQALANRLNVLVIGIEPSAKMLAEAKKKLAIGTPATSTSVAAEIPSPATASASAGAKVTGANAIGNIFGSRKSD